MRKRRGKKLTVCLGIAVLLSIALTAFYGPRIVAWLEFVSLFGFIGKNDQGYAEYRHRTTGIVMVLVSGGEFRMGSAAGQPGSRSNEQPQRVVTLSSFLIAKQELVHRIWNSSASKSDEADVPVTDVSWSEATRFCRDLGLDLPTEAQWEYACRTARDREVVSRRHDGNDGLQSTSQKKTNAFGLRDMHGGVRELCRDFYHEDCYRSHGSDRDDPLCAVKSRTRVVRGSNSTDDWAFRSSFRYGIRPSESASTVGFRPAYDILPVNPHYD